MSVRACIVWACIVWACIARAYLHRGLVLWAWIAWACIVRACIVGLHCAGLHVRGSVLAARGDLHAAGTAGGEHEGAIAVGRARSSVIAEDEAVEPELFG